MSEPAPPPPGSDHDSLNVRHVLAIVLVGVTLGIGFNALQLSADNSRGLAWVKSERRVVSLADVPPVSSATPAVAAAPAAPQVPESRSAPPAAALPQSATRAPDPALGGAQKGPAKPAPAPHATLTPSAPPSAMPAPGSHTPAVPPAPASSAAAGIPAPSASAASAADLPAIPDSRDPIEVGTDVALKFHAAGAALFLDARSAQEYAEGHIAGAVHLSWDDVFKNPALAKSVDARGRVLITYCDGGDCDLSRNLAFSLIDSGFRKVLVFKDGLPAWKSAGGSVRTGAQP